MSFIFKGNPAKISRIGISMRPKRGRGLRVPHPDMERSGSLAGFSLQLTNGEMSGVKCHGPGHE
jgi:hypothetical protein